MPFVWIALAFIAGIFAASQMSGSQQVWWIGLALALLAGVLVLLGRKLPLFSRLGWRVPGTRLPACLLPACAVLGGCLYLYAQPISTADTIFFYNDSGRTLMISAVVAEPPDLRARSSLVVMRVTGFKVDGVDYPSGELIMAMLPANTDLVYGDQLRLYARPETPFEDDEFSYRQYLETRSIFSILPYPRIAEQRPAERITLLTRIYSLKQRLVMLNAEIFPPPESGLITGILLGPRNNIPDDLYEAFKSSGTSHIIAISGFNVAILAALISSICLRTFGKWRGALIAIITITFYTLLVGGSASVVRASIMGALAILAQLIGRRQAGVNTLALTAFGMLLFNPLLLWDVGFQLSFCATLGLVWFAGPMQEWFKVKAARFIPQVYLQRTADWTGEYVLFTIATQITTLPLLAYHFHRVPLASMLANPLVLPAQPPLMIGSGLALLAGLIWLPLGRIAGALAVPFASYTIRVVEWTAGLHLPELWINEISLIAVLIYFSVLMVLIYQTGWRKKVKVFINPASLLVGAALITAMIWQWRADLPDGRLNITLAGGSANGAALIQSPAGRSILINGGEDRNALLAFIGRRLPRMQSTLDFLVLTPGKNADLRAIPGTLGQLEPGEILMVGTLSDIKTAADLTSTAGELRISIREISMGDTLDLGEGALLTILYPGDKGNILRITWQDFSMLFVSGKVDSASLPSAGVVYFNGDGEIGFPEFTPQIVLSNETIPSGELRVISTLQHGWINITTDGKHMWLEGEK